MINHLPKHNLPCVVSYILRVEASILFFAFKHIFKTNKFSEG